MCFLPCDIHKAHHRYWTGFCPPLSNCHLLSTLRTLFNSSDLNSLLPARNTLYVLSLCVLCHFLQSVLYCIILATLKACYDVTVSNTSKLTGNETGATSNCWKKIREESQMTNMNGDFHPFYSAAIPHHHCVYEAKAKCLFRQGKIKNVTHIQYNA